MNTVLLLIILGPLIEIYLLIKIGSQIGALSTISLILLTAFMGILYARYEGFNTLKSAIKQLLKNEIPVYEIISGAALAFAAFLLILPKLFSAIIKITIYSFLMNKDKREVYYQRFSGLLNAILCRKSWYRPKL